MLGITQVSSYGQIFFAIKPLRKQKIDWQCIHFESLFYFLQEVIFIFY